MEETIEDELERIARDAKVEEDLGRLRNLSEVTNYTIDNYVYVEIPKGRYNVSKDIIIKEKGTLEIEPGTELYFKQNGGIISHGTLKAIGTEEERILFTASKEGWKNIAIAGNLASETNLEYCIISKGSGRWEIPNTDYLYRYGVSLHKYVYGGGIMIIKANPTITNCIIKNNNSQVGGGICGRSLEIGTGIYGMLNLTLKGNIISDNTGIFGGGIYIWNSNPIIEGNKIINNKAKWGGGLYLSGSDSTREENAMLKDNIIVNNQLKGKSNYGGGLCLAKSNPTMNNNTIENNTPDNIRRL